ncbi:hypothetical protein PAPYR_13101 [Paratrimastix pyriformis]|uniref:GIY-YIG domain-containing protein n=1 Tax=Paratrimastix pyriformis TaxID=342808 RepID=A0ABQ8U5U3_9EUKA|nr:hypothetical protein PAPYR_13101 [Paratrimastix pyriformis]
MEGKVPTLYLLSDRRRHVYVGTTVNLTHRVLQHNGLLAGAHSRPRATGGTSWPRAGAPLEQIRQLEDLLHRPDSGCGFRKPVTVKQTVGALCSPSLASSSTVLTCILSPRSAPTSPRP